MGHDNDGCDQISYSEKSMSGVFGSGDVVGQQKNNSGNRGRSRINPTFELGQMRYWPWIDIVCITITCVMAIYVISNFENVTDKLFFMILPILSDTVILFIIAGIILCLALWFNRRRRMRW